MSTINIIQANPHQVTVTVSPTTQTVFEIRFNTGGVQTSRFSSGDAVATARRAKNAVAREKVENNMML